MIMKIKVLKTINHIFFLYDWTVAKTQVTLPYLYLFARNLAATSWFLSELSLRMKEITDSRHLNSGFHIY